jgi:hypothetical protein
MFVVSMQNMLLLNAERGISCHVAHVDGALERFSYQKQPTVHLLSDFVLWNFNSNDIRY